MKVLENGVYRNMTEEEKDLYDTETVISSYEERVVNRIREKYSIDDELAILRQKDAKPGEFEQYNAFVEEIKAEERARS